MYKDCPGNLLLFLVIMNHVFSSRNWNAVQLVGSGRPGTRRSANNVYPSQVEMLALFTVYFISHSSYDDHQEVLVLDSIYAGIRVIFLRRVKISTFQSAKFKPPDIPRSLQRRGSGVNIRCSNQLNSIAFLMCFNIAFC